MTDHEPISTPFTSASTAQEVLYGIDLAGIRAIVTGGSSGLGIETARALTAAGAEVTLAVRNTAAGDAVADTIEKSTRAIRPRVLRLDLADSITIERFVDAWDGALHLLINNAGLVTGGLQRTPQGWVGTAVRHQPPRPLRSRYRSSRCPGPRGVRTRRSTDRLPQLDSAHALRHRLQRPPFRASQLRPPDCLRPIEDGELPVRRAGNPSVGVRRHRRQRGEPRRCRDRTATELHASAEGVA